MTIRRVQSSDNEVLTELIRAVFLEHDAPREGTVYSDITTDQLYQLLKNENSVFG